MSIEDRVEEGFEILQDTIRTVGNLELITFKYNFDRETYYVEVGSDSRTLFDFVLPMEFLHDLPSTKEYKASLSRFVKGLRQREQNGTVSEFHCLSGVPIQIEFVWPMERYRNKAANFLRANVRDTRNLSRLAKCAVVIPWSLADEPEWDPFRLIEVSVNLIRYAVDGGLIEFFEMNEQPETFQDVDTVEAKPKQRHFSLDDIQFFLASKVYWLAFKRSSKDSRVWIADVWDASYLGVTPKELLQAAQVLDAKGAIKVSSEIASADDGLLLRSDMFEGKIKQSEKIGF